MNKEFDIGKFLGFYFFAFCLFIVFSTLLIENFVQHQSNLLLDLQYVITGALSFQQFEEHYGWAMAYGAVVQVILSLVLAVFPAYVLAISNTAETIESGRVLKDLSSNAPPIKLSNTPDTHIYLHPYVKVDKSALVGNVLCLGAQGTGKSTITKHLLDQLVHRTGKLVIFDEKGEYTQRYYDPSDTVLLGYSEECHAWDLQTDFSSKDQISALANSLIDSSSSTGDPFWNRMAAGQLNGYLLIAQGRGGVSFNSLNSAMALDKIELTSFIDAHCPHLRNVMQGNSNTIESGSTVATTNILWIDSIALAEQKLSKFSVRDFLGPQNTKIKKLIIRTSHENAEVSKRIFAAVLETARTELLKRDDLPYSKLATELDLWLVLDELASIPRSDALKEILAKGRSKGVHVVAGTQSPSQVAELYGLQGSTTLYNLFQNIAALKPGPLGENSSLISQCLGSQTVKYQKGDSGFSEQVTRAVVPVSALDELPLANEKGVTGYLITTQYPKTVFKLTWPHASTPRNNKLFVKSIEPKLALQSVVPEQKEAKEDRLFGGRKS